MNPYILWLGSIFDQKSVMSSKAISPAANNWQTGLINPLCEKGVKIITLGHTPEPIWPKGRAKMNSLHYKTQQKVDCFITDYMNLPFVRNSNLISKYKNLSNRIISQHGLPQLVLSYNSYNHNSITAMALQKQFHIPWICIVADMPTKQKELIKQSEYLSRSSGNIFLSWEMYQNSDSLHKLHLDGGIANPKYVDMPNLESNTQKQIVLYAGSLTRWGGVNSLLDGFELISHSNTELWICGPGTNKKVEIAANSNKNIKNLGFLTDAELEQICKKASIFVNPRPSHILGNEYNFPSKLFEYFRYLKPIVSTKTAGISPEYENILITPKNDTPKAIANKIAEVLDWDETKRTAHIKTMLKFVQKNKTWNHQADRLIQWLITDFKLNICKAQQT